MGFPGGSGVKNSPASAGDARDVGSIPGSGRSPGGKNGNPLQYSCLEIPLGRGAWWATMHWGHKESDTTEHVHGRTHTHTHTEYSTGNYIQQSLINLNEIEKKCLSWERERVFDVWTLSPHGPE